LRSFPKQKDINQVDKKFPGTPNRSPTNSEAMAIIGNFLQKHAFLAMIVNSGSRSWVWNFVYHRFALFSARSYVCFGNLPADLRGLRLLSSGLFMPVA